MIPAGVYCLDCGNDYLARDDEGLVYCLKCRDTVFVTAGPPGPITLLTRFVFARLREDERRDSKRVLFRRYHQGFTAHRRQAFELAGGMYDDPEMRDLGEKWMRGIAKNYRRHPDYREEWKP